MREEAPLTTVDPAALEACARTLGALRDTEWLPALAAIRRVLAEGVDRPVLGVSGKHAAGRAAGVAHRERTERMLAYLDALERGLGPLVDLPARLAREYAGADADNAAAIGPLRVGDLAGRVASDVEEILRAEDPGRMREHAAAWARLGALLAEVRDACGRHAAIPGESWDGLAAVAFAEAVGELRRGLGANGEIARSTARGLSAMADAVDAARAGVAGEEAATDALSILDGACERLRCEYAAGPEVHPGPGEPVEPGVWTAWDAVPAAAVASARAAGRRAEKAAPIAEALRGEPGPAPEPAGDPAPEPEGEPEPGEEAADLLSLLDRHTARASADRVHVRLRRRSGR